MYKTNIGICFLHSTPNPPKSFYPILLLDMQQVGLKNLDYLILLLNTSKIQAESLLDTATPSQIETISQICRNLKVISLEKVVSESIQKRHRLFSRLSLKKKQTRIKGKLISKHRRFLLSIFLALKPTLVPVIEHFKEEGTSKQDIET